MCLFFLFFPFLSFPAVVYFYLWSDIEARGSAQRRCSAPDLSLAQLLLHCGPLSYVTFFLTVFLLRERSSSSFLPPSSFSQESCQSSIHSELGFHDAGSSRLPGTLLADFGEKHLHSFSLGVSYPKITFLIQHCSWIKTLQLSVNNTQAPATPCHPPQHH